jgi:CubicO group peptidase (beta-lactamase class C family)
MAIDTVAGDITDSLFVELSKLVINKQEEHSVPGVGVGVIYEGKEYLAGFGVTSLENPKYVDADTLFQIGSISKTFTATLAMRLVEAGKLDLSAPVRKYIPDFKLQDEEAAAAVTVLDLFTHKAGWVGDWFLDTGWGDDATAKFVSEMATFEQLTPLGAVWSYNNASFTLAGRIIEIASGLNFEKAMQDYIFNPLGMKEAFFFAHDAITRKVTNGHINKKVSRPWALRRASHAAGAICTSVSEMMQYARFQLGDGTAYNGTRLLSSENMRQMQTEKTKASNNMADATGVAWMLRDVGGVMTIGHGGATNGYMAAFYMVPEQNFAICLLTNSSSGGLLNRDVLKWAFDRFCGGVEPELTEIEMSEANLQEYLGTYEAALTKHVFTLQDGVLNWQAVSKGGFPTKDTPPLAEPPAPVKVAFYAEDKIFGLDEPFKGTKSEFLRNPDGTIGWYRSGGRISRPVKD